MKSTAPVPCQEDSAGFFYAPISESSAGCRELSLLTGCLILSALIALLIYAKVKPESGLLPGGRLQAGSNAKAGLSVAFPTHAEVYDKNDRIRLINAGRFEYVPH